MDDKEKVIYFFKEISKIPRETAKEQLISDYLIRFAQERNLDVDRDSCLNVIIKKKATIPNCKSDGIIIQAHTDMVYVKEENSNHIYEKGIEVLEKDGLLYADGTTLGADNGVAVAYCLTLLDSQNIKHPDLEILFTTQEEAGLVGASVIDVTGLKGKYLINLDGEEEGVFLTSCAGGIRNLLTVDTQKVKTQGQTALEIKISGLKGGHSGVEINLGRGNAIKYLAKLLYSINGEDMELASVEAVGKPNAIPSAAKATIIVPNSKKDEIVKSVQKLESVYKNELFYTDNINITVEEQKLRPFSYDTDTKNKIINILNLMPFGVIHNSYAIENLVETSTNVGSLDEYDDRITMLSSTRSSIASYKYDIINTIEILAKIYNAKSESFNDYPQWQHKRSSKLRDIIEQKYQEIYGTKPKFTAIHAGLECGYFDAKLKDVDIISFGATLFDVHTPRERAQVQSIKNVWDFLLLIIEELSKQV